MLQKFICISAIEFYGPKITKNKMKSLYNSEYSQLFATIYPFKAC